MLEQELLLDGTKQLVVSLMDHILSMAPEGQKENARLELYYLVQGILTNRDGDKFVGTKLARFGELPVTA